MSEGVLGEYETQRAAQREAAGRFDLTGHVAVVTGFKGRLGQVWAKALHESGAIVCGSDTADAMRGDSPFKGVDTNVADLTSIEDVEKLCRGICSCYGVPTIVVNNAGVDDRPRAGVMNGPRYDVARAMADVNLLGTYTMLNVFGERMAQEGRGSIINVASLYGIVAPDMRYYGESAFRKHAMYGATKAGIINLTKYYAAFFGPRGVRVNAVAPGGVVDPHDPLTGQDDTFKKNYTARIPMGRMCTPDDLAGPIVFLASKASGFITGQTIALDGGFTCW